MAFAMLLWAFCLAAAPVSAHELQDTAGLLQTDVAIGRTELDRMADLYKPKKAKRKPGASDTNSSVIADRPADAANASDSNASLVADTAGRNSSLAANATVGANTTVDVHHSRDNATAAAEENASTSWCGYEAQEGLFTAFTKPNSDNLLLDLSEAFKRTSTIRYVVTAMTVRGTYADGAGYIMEYASPMEETSNTMFEMKMNKDGISVDMFKPELDIRTSDNESLVAMKRSMGSGRFQTLPTYRCAERPAGNFMLKGTSTLASERLASVISKHEGSSAEKEGSVAQDGGIPKDLHLEAVGSPLVVASSSSSGSAASSHSGRTIINGGVLIRAGFFVAPSMKTATAYKVKAVKVFKQNIDVTVEYIVDGQPIVVGFSLVELPVAPMRPRLADDRLLYFTTDYRDLGEHNQFKDELPGESVDRKVSTIWRYNIQNKSIRIHIDPTVPKRWRKWFRRGVEAWNEAFGLIGRPDAVRAVLPEDKDWPKDYDVSDARFSTISWTITRDVVSMGIAKVDPRSGEILKSDIIMSDGWVQAWLGDLDLLAPNYTHSMDEGKGFRFEGHPEASVLLHRQRVPGRLHFNDADWGKKISLLALARGEPLQKNERHEIIGKGLQNVVTHETGHILGLRHNFKGSLGVTYACVRSPSCSAENGLTASVMDYVPVNLPTPEEPDVHLFSPVLGGYDKLAIKYGYMEVHPNESISSESRSILDQELRVVLREAEKYETCYDADRVSGQDPSCMAYDISSDPLAAYEDELKRLAAVQANLLNTSVMPGAPYTHYGEAADQVLLLSRSIGVKLVGWIGGVQNSYLNRRLDGSSPGKVARRPLTENVQKRALGMLLRLLRPEKAGLLPPPESMPYLVSASDGAGSVEAVDLDGHVRSVIRTLISKALDPDQLMRIHAQERLEAMQEDTDCLTMGTFMSKFAQGIVGEGLATTSPSEWELHRLLAKGLEQVHKSSSLPGSVRAHAAHQLMKLRSEAEVALAQIELGRKEVDPDAPPRDQELMKAHLAGLHQQLTSAICGDGTTKECVGLESAAAPSTRLGMFGILALGFTALLTHTP